MDGWMAEWMWDWMQNDVDLLKSIDSDSSLSLSPSLSASL